MLEMKVWSSRIFCQQKTTKLGVSVSLTLIKLNGGFSVSCNISSHFSKNCISNLCYIEGKLYIFGLKFCHF